MAKRPYWAKAVQIGDMLTIKPEYLGRGGECGKVLSADEEGVALDFFCDRNGDPLGLPTQEFWEWGEVDPDELPARIAFSDEGDESDVNLLAAAPQAPAQEGSA